MIRLIAPVLAMSLVFTACGDDNDDTTETGQGLSAIPDDLDGQWKTACLPSDVLELTHTQREYIINRIGDFDKVERFYSDDACTQLVGEYKVIGTAEAKGDSAEGEDPEAKQINFTINNAEFTVTGDTALAAFNSLNLCGKSDWKLNEKASVLNANCLGSTVRKGDVIFELYAVKNEQLYFGQNFIFLTQSNAGARPTKLNTEVPLAKQ